PGGSRTTCPWGDEPPAGVFPGPVDTRPGIKLVSPALAGRFLTTGAPAVAVQSLS
ncbi:unnamed protein product, partial [Rangifer tarandus platyrhynchus]